MSEPGNNESNVPEVQAHKIQAAHQATHALQVKRFHHILQSDAARHKIKLGRRLSSIKAPVAVASIAQRHDAQSSDQPLPTDDRDAVASFHIVIENETSPCFLNLAVDEPTPDCECGFPAQLRQRFVYGGTIEPTVVDADGLLSYNDSDEHFLQYVKVVVTGTMGANGKLNLYFGRSK